MINLGTPNHVTALSTQVALGSGCGCLNFLFFVSAKKICHLAGVHFEEVLEPEAIQPHERFDRDFYQTVIVDPFLHEFLFRGLFQFFLTRALVVYIPIFSQVSTFELSVAQIVSSIGIGVIFGYQHSLAFTQGAKATVMIQAIQESILGLMMERLGMESSLTANITYHFLLRFYEKHYFKDLNSCSPKVEKECLAL